MYDELVDKLVEVDGAAVLERIVEAVATKLSPEKKMRKYYKNVLNGKLKPSTMAFESWMKFFILKNGDYVPVVRSHAGTAQKAGTSLYDLEEVGVVSGSVDAGHEALQVEIDTKLTKRQIARLRQFYIEYKPVDLYASIDGKSFDAPIKSVEHLNYLLTYGKEETYESIEEAIEVPEYLYHGTFRPLLSKIKSEGLRTTGTVKNYSDSEEGLIYLAKTPEEAEAFAEVSETVPDEWVDQVVVLRIDTDKLDKSKLGEDPNVRSLEVMTFQYSENIPIDAFTLV